MVQLPDMSGFADLSNAAAAARRARPGTAIALATLVGVEGSSYRQPGARLLVDAEGRVLAGAISGGCLEGDVAARAAAVCERGAASTLVYDLRSDLEAIWGFGSACDGIATVLLEPYGDWMGDAERIRVSRRGGAVLTHLGRDASHADADGIVAVADGDMLLPIGPIMHERDARDGNPVTQEHIMRGVSTSMRTGRAQVVRTESGAYFIDPLVAPIALHVIGAGRGAEAFARIASTLGWEVVVADHRPALLESLSLPDGVRSTVMRPEDVEADTLVQDARTAVALLTHIFDTDLAWLARFVPSAVGYIGVLGSRQRAARLLGRLAADGVRCTPAMLHRVHAPIGLDLGGETPESIALAAIAEIEAVMHARPGGLLRERQSPIHERTPVPAEVPRTDASVGAVTRSRDTVIVDSCLRPRPDSR